MLLMRALAMFSFVCVCLYCACGPRAGAQDAGESGPPYLYVTFHGGKHKHDINNIYRYTRDGQLAGSVLEPQYGLNELRGIEITSSGKVLVANAHMDDSKILEFGACTSQKQDSIKRKFDRVLVPFDPDNNPGLNHPYGIAFGHHDGNIYVSMQNTNSVIRFDSSGDPVASPPAILDAFKSPGLFPGVFVMLDWDEEVRDIAFDHDGFLYVACKEQGLLIYDREGYLKNHLQYIQTPIGVHFNKHTRRVYVGSNEGKKSHVYEFQALGNGSLELAGTYKHKDLSHPAGIATDDVYLYVISQAKGKILRFFLHDHSFDRVILDNLPDVGEYLFMSPC